MTDPANALPALDGATERALRASIERFGVLVPAIRDERTGELVDGRTRLRIAGELGVECPVVRRPFPEDPTARAEAVAQLNDARRQRMTAEQRREVVAELREDGHSLRAIAAAVGASKSQVAKDAAAVSTSGQPKKPPPWRPLDSAVKGFARAAATFEALDVPELAAAGAAADPERLAAWDEQITAAARQLVRLRKGVHRLRAKP